MPYNKIVFHIVYVIILFFFSNCTIVEDNIEKQELIVESNVQQIIDDLKKPIIEKRLIWKEAISLLFQNNIELSSIELENYQAKQAINQTIKELIPTLDLRTGYSRFLNDSSQLFADGWRYGIDSYFNFAAIIQLPAKLYAAKLRIIRSDINKELKERELMIKLYLIFSKYRSIENKEKYLHWRIKLAGNLLSANDSDDYQSVKSVFKKLIEEKDSISEELSNLIWDTSFKWIPSNTTKLPTLNYTEKPLRLDDFKNFANKQIKILAIELEGARLRKKEITRAYWPRFNVSLSTPSLYRNDGRNEALWSVEDMRAGADATWAIDTRGKIKMEKLAFEKEMEIQEKKLLLETKNLLIKLAKANQRLAAIKIDREKLNRGKQLYAELPAPSSISDFKSRLSAMDQWQQKILELDLEKMEIETSFWFFDDLKWDTHEL